MSANDDVTSPGLLLLQGGAEFGPGCREMDAAVLSLAPPGPVVVVLGAAAPGRDHAAAAGRAETYYRHWQRPVRVTPHPQVDPHAAADAVAEAAVIVLPGGSPARLLGSLLGADGLLADAVGDRLAAGAAISGASAGAMVLCERVVLPDRGGEVTDGLGLLPGLVQPHFGGQFSWLDPRSPEGPRWGLPECGGVLLDASGARAAGQGGAQLWRRGGAAPLPATPTPVSELLS